MSASRSSAATSSDVGPEIALDVTYAELYAAGQPAGCKKHVYVPFFPSTAVDLSDACPRVKKYMYHDTHIDDNSTAEEIEEYRVTASAKYLGLLGQRLAFTAGHMPLVVFSHPNSPDGNGPWLERTFNRLVDTQRPIIRHVPGPADVRLAPDEVLAVSFPLDTLDALPHAVDPEAHYELLSKRGLAVSGLCTPRATLLDLAQGAWKASEAPQTVAVVERRVESDSDVTARKRVVATDASSPPQGTVDLAEYIRARPLPFVIKLQQSVSGAGTWLVTTPAEQRAAADEVPRIVAHYLPQVEESGEHLRPCSLVFTDFVADVAETFSLAMFVQHGGSPVFLGSTEQEMDQGRWTGGSVRYSAQPTLQKRLDRTMRDIARFLWSRGYYGPVGADVLEDKQGNQWVVDLNVRTPSSLVLTVLRTHFAVQRGMDVAQIMPSLRPKIGRDEFVAALEDAFRDGSLIILAWVENGKGGAHYASLIVGAESDEKLAKLTERVCALCPEE